MLTLEELNQLDALLDKLTDKASGSDKTYSTDWYIAMACRKIVWRLRSKLERNPSEG